MLNRWLREPLLHFILLGAALFILFYQVAEPEVVSDNRIVITEADIDRMITLFERKFHRLPTRQELNGLVEAQIREEVLYREALVMGLDQDDTIVRRRMAQKLEFLFTDLADATDPADAELQRFLSDNPDKFIEPARSSFIHVYFNDSERADTAETDAQQLLAVLNSNQESVDLANAGDPFMFGYTFDRQSEHQASRMFGNEFARALDTLTAGAWHGPIVSAYGLHLVFIKEREDAWLPALDEIRDSVRNEWLAVQRRQVNNAFYQSLRDRYDVIVWQPPEQQNTVSMEAAQ